MATIYPADVADAESGPEGIAFINSYVQDANPDGSTQSMPDQSGGGVSDFLKRIYSGAQSVVSPSINGDPVAGNGSGVLDKLLNFSLARDQIGLQRQYLGAAQTVGYRGPLYAGQAAPAQNQDPVFRLLIIGGIAWVIVQAAKAA